MCGYRIAIRKVFEIGGQFSAVFEMNAALIIYARDGDDFAIGRAEIRVASIGCQKQLVACSYFHRLPLIDFECSRVFRGYAMLLPAVVSGNYGFSLCTHHFERFVLGDAFDCGGMSTVGLEGSYAHRLSAMQSNSAEHHAPPARIRPGCRSVLGRRESLLLPGRFLHGWSRRPGHHGC